MLRVQHVVVVCVQLQQPDAGVMAVGECKTVRASPADLVGGKQERSESVLLAEGTCAQQPHAAIPAAQRLLLQLSCAAAHSTRWHCRCWQQPPG
jgi:hypothetical protein